MCTLSLEDIGELRDEWLRQPKAQAATDGRVPAAPAPASAAHPAFVAPLRREPAGRLDSAGVAA